MWQTGPLNCTGTKTLKAAASTHIYFAIFLSQKVLNEVLKCPRSLPSKYCGIFVQRTKIHKQWKYCYNCTKKRQKNGTDATDNKYGV